MPRPTMGTLITEVKRLINDPSNETWTDDQIQRVMDQRRLEAVQVQLSAKRVRSTSDWKYLIYSHPYGDWEDEAQLYDSGFNEVTADTVDLITGRWEFSDEPAYPIYLSGFTYDLHAAAADLLEEKALTMVGDFDFAADGGSYKRSQSRSGVEKLAAKYRRRQRVSVGAMVRGDINV